MVRAPDSFAADWIESTAIECDPTLIDPDTKELVQRFQVELEYGTYDLEVMAIQRYSESDAWSSRTESKLDDVHVGTDAFTPLGIIEIDMSRD